MVEHLLSGHAEALGYVFDHVVSLRPGGREAVSNVSVDKLIVGPFCTNSERSCFCARSGGGWCARFGRVSVRTAEKLKLRVASLGWLHFALFLFVKLYFLLVVVLEAFQFKRYDVSGSPRF